MPEPVEPPRFGIPDVFVGLLVWIVAQLAIGVVVGSLTHSLDVTIVTSELVGLAILVGWPISVSRRKGSGSIRDDFGSRFVFPLDVGLGVVLGFVILFASGMLQAVLRAATGASPSTNVDQVLGQQSSSLGQAIVVVMAAVGAPFAEELFFRGLALRAFARRWGGVWAIVASTALFAVLHVFGASGAFGGRAILVAGIAVYGAAFGAAAWVTGRLGPSIAAHMTINTLATIVYFTLVANHVT